MIRLHCVINIYCQSIQVITPNCSNTFKTSFFSSAILTIALNLNFGFHFFLFFLQFLINISLIFLEVLRFVLSQYRTFFLFYICVTMSFPFN